MKLGQEITVKDEDQSITGTLVCIAKDGSSEVFGDYLLYFKNINYEKINKLNIDFCTEIMSSTELYENILESFHDSPNDLLEIDGLYFSNDKVPCHFGWVHKKDMVQVNNIASDSIQINDSNKLTCSRCNNQFSKSINGLICFKCCIYSTDLIYQK